MTIEKVNELLVSILDETDFWMRQGQEAEKVLTYISGVNDMASLVKKHLEQEMNA